MPNAYMHLQGLRENASEQTAARLRRALTTPTPYDADMVLINRVNTVLNRYKSAMRMISKIDALIHEKE